MATLAAFELFSFVSIVKDKKIFRGKMEIFFLGIM